MTMPVWMVLAFAGWTLLTLSFSVGVYRWAHILTGRTAIGDFRGGAVEGSDFYGRAMRAHANCVENLPVFAAIVFAAREAGLDDPMLDVLASVLMGARVVHTLVHLSFVQTNLVSSVRFTSFFVQLVCMFGMGVQVATAAL